MSKPVKSICRFLAWLFSVVIAAGVLVGCGEKKYGPPVAKYGPPPVSGYQDNIKGNNVS